MADAQHQAAVPPTTGDMQKQEPADAKPRAQNPRANAGKQYYWTNPNLTPNQGRVPYDAKGEIAALRKKLQESEAKVQDIHQKWMASIGRAARCPVQFDQLQKHYNYCRASAEGTITDIKKQLEKALGNKPKNNSGQRATDKKPTTAKLQV